jgi:outer membrane protein assembly factor BamB
MKMHIAVKLASVSMIAMLAGCTSWNPFAAPPANAPAALLDFKSSIAVRTAWSTSVGRAGAYLFSPAYAKDSIYVAAADGALTRLDAANGRVLWKVNASSNLTAGVGSDGDTVAVAAAKGVVMVFDGDGKLRWKAQMSSDVLSPPAVGEGVVVVHSVDNRIVAFDAQTGVRRWNTQRTAPPLVLRGAPGLVIDSGTVYAAMPGGKLLALTINNGGVRWEAAVAEPRGATELERISDVAGLPVIQSGDICATAYQGRVACFNTSNGVVRWSKELSSSVGPGVDERFVFAVDSHAVISGYAREAGQSVWRNDKLQNRQLSAPVSFGRAVAVGDLKGFVHFLSREDGSLIGRIATDGSPIIGTPMVAGAHLILQTQSGTVVALAAE